MIIFVRDVIFQNRILFGGVGIAVKIVSYQERSAPPETLIKCKLCDAIFYNKKAWESHNLLHSPDDLYIKSEEDRKLAVAR